MKALALLHQGLVALGGVIGQLAIFLIAFLLLVSPAFAGLCLCLFGALAIERETGGGGFVSIPILLVLFSLSGRYVWIPHLAGPLTRAAKELLNSN